MTKDKPLTVILQFMWDTCTPDPRQFNQQRQILNPDYLIEIDIPLNTKYIRNKADILVAQTSKDMNVPAPILTPAGMFLAIFMLEKPFEDDREERTDKLLEDSDVDWSRNKETNVEEDETEDWVVGEAELVSAWPVEVADTDEQSQFEPDETVIPDFERGVEQRVDEDKTPDWSDKKSWD